MSHGKIILVYTQVLIAMVARADSDENQ